MKKSTDNPWKMIGLIGSVGLEVFVLIVGGAWLGRKLDAHFQTEPVWLAVGVLGGLIIGMISAAITIRTLAKKM
ncbi:AtpZ/AtpI family protein [Paludifilum halophilum]|uniref:AtpZ/AtpI family protein n=1 Tax=Paludifilum halophilum TaxID=1642702 RepID=UPI00146AC58A|nr:AtpZ/AtpI family protein [Paludifilum halophilum]